MADLFYLQDSRTYVGNDVLWWATDGKGYTTDLRAAQVYTRDQAMAQHESRITDIPWPKEYIDQKVRPAVDMQYIERREAAFLYGVVLREQPKPRRDVLRCHGCGRYMSEVQLWTGKCDHCGADNRP